MSSPEDDVDPDVELWRRVVHEGDGDAFAALYDRHVPRVATFLARRLDRQDVDDLTAEVFLQAWRQRDRLVVTQASGLAPWLIGVARNLAYARRRQRARERNEWAHVGLEVDEDDPGEEVVRRDERRIASENARRALAMLDEQDREVIELCLMGELPPSSVAEFLRQPPSTVRSRLTRARRRLAAAYRSIVEASDDA